MPSILVYCSVTALLKYFKPDRPSLPSLLTTNQKQTVDQFIKKVEKNSAASKCHAMVTLPKKNLLPLESTVLKMVQLGLVDSFYF